ncbi:MAG: pyridoxamine 5'-phosphate oxidase family protein [Rhodospirillales bacterium]|nr:pyridoxamine 5'-phosphate oxidase family protein [Rhodospirillales bacterium]
MAKIETIEQLRKIYKPVVGRAAEKVLYGLEKYSRQFIELSPFLVISSMGTDGVADISPRGEKPGFVQILDDLTVAIPDRPGNNRIDTFTNILSNPAVGLIFLIPGMNEVLRLQGDAEIRDDEDLMARFEVNGKLPRAVVVVKLREVYLHCAKAIMRSELWEDSNKIDRTIMPSMGQMLKEQIGSPGPAETQEEMVARHYTQLY